MHRVPPAELGRDREEIFAYPAWRFHDAAGDVAEHPGIVYGLWPEAYYRLVCRNGKLIGSNFFGDNGSAGAVKTATEGV